MKNIRRNLLNNNTVFVKRTATLMSGGTVALPKQAFCFHLSETNSPAQQKRYFFKALKQRAAKAVSRNNYSSNLNKEQLDGTISVASTTTLQKNATATAVEREYDPKADAELVKKVEELYGMNHYPLIFEKHRKLGEPYANVAAVELGTEMRRHVRPTGTFDRLALFTMLQLRKLTHLFFRERYAHHAVVLETVAAVPGMVAGMLRHFRSLRTMERDHGKIPLLLEEAENERMHLLIWMQHAKPSFTERMLVMAAQIGYTTFYGAVYIISPSLAHRLVGYLEEEAFEAYTLFLKAIDEKKVPNPPAPEIAKRYYNLAPDATVRDCVVMIRADEAMHRDFNHEIANKHRHGIH